MKNQPEIKKIAMYDLEGHLLEIFEVETYVELEELLELPRGSVHGCVHNYQHQTNNRQFRETRKGKQPLMKIGDISHLIDGKEFKTVIKLYKGRIICTYASLREAADKNNIGTSNISGYITGRKDYTRRHAGGFQWKYTDDENNSVNDNE